MSKDFTQKRLNYIGICLSLLWPFWSMVYGLFLDRKFAFKGLLILFCFYGFTLNITQESDMSRYIEQFEYHSYSKESNLFTEYISGNHSDYYLISIIFLVKSVSSSSSVYLTVITFIYSYFYLSSIFLIFNYLTNRTIARITLFEVALTFVTFFYVPIFFINGIRFYTALYFYIYCVLKLIIDKNQKFKYFVIITPLIHISFIIVVLVFFIFTIIGKKRLFCLFFLILSILAPFFFSWNLEKINVGEGVSQTKINNYTNLEMKDKFNENLDEIHNNASVKWRIYNFINTSHFYLVLIVFVLLLSNSELRKLIDSINSKLINFNILMLALCFFVRDIPESYRFNHLFIVSFLFSMIYVYRSTEGNEFLVNNRKYLNLLIYCLLPYTLSVVYLYIPTLSWKVFASNWLIELLWI